MAPARGIREGTAPKGSATPSLCCLAITVIAPERHRDEACQRKGVDAGGPFVIRVLEKQRRAYGNGISSHASPRPHLQQRKCMTSSVSFRSSSSPQRRCKARDTRRAWRVRVTVSLSSLAGTDHCGSCLMDGAKAVLAPPGCLLLLLQAPL